MDRAERPPAGGAPAISVVMPCFNGAAHLRTSVASALGQTFSDLELIVVDDGSTDDSAALLAGLRDPRLRVLRQDNQGVCRARNAGLSVARGQFIAFLDADDTWAPHCLETLHAALQRSGVALAYCGWQNIGLPGPRGEPYIPPEFSDSEKLTQLFHDCRWPIHACLTRRNLIADAGGFDPRFKTSEDYLLWLRIGKDHAIERVPQVLAYYHFHGGAQATSNRARMAINHFEAQRTFLREHPDDARRIPAAVRKASMQGRLLQRGLECHWRRDLAGARSIFRKLLQVGHVDLRHWKQILPALLPLAWHAYLMAGRDSHPHEPA